MNREIKFRGWHKGYSQKDAIMLHDKKSGDCLKWQADGQPIIVMQFTGLKDKNGIDIYEGDFLKLHEYGEDVYKEVVFHNGSFCIHGFNWERKTAEVIGNIYQNPELK